jgi:hypothetical protein
MIDNVNDVEFLIKSKSLPIDNKLNQRLPINDYMKEMPDIVKFYADQSIDLFKCTFDMD